MVSEEQNEPAGTATEVVETMERRGGVARLVARLLAHGIDDDGDWNRGRLNRHLALLDDRNTLRQSTEILKVAVDEPEFDTATIELIDAVLDTYAGRDATPVLDWVAAHKEAIR